MANRNMNLDVIVRLKDLLSGPLRGLKGALEGISSAARKIGIVGTAIAGITFLGPMQEAAAFQQQLIDIAGTSNLVGAEAFAFVDQSKARFEQLGLEIGQYSDVVAKGAGQMIAAGVSEKLVDASIGSIGKAATAANAEMNDMASVATSLLTTLKLPAEQLDDSLGALVTAGKLGSFELKDMAKYFPTLTGQMAKFGVTGREAVNFLGAALQIARKGTSDPAEAANNLKNFLSKILAPVTVKNFADMGVDIQGVMQDAVTKGINPIEAVVQKITKLTGVSGKEIQGLMKKAKDAGMTDAEALGSVRKQLEKIYGAGKLGDLFSDMQVMDFLIPMLGNIDEYKSIKEEVAKATGSAIDADFETQMQGLNRQLTIFKEIGTQGMREVGLAFGTWMPAINGHLMDALKWLRELDASTGGMVKQGLAFAGVAVLLIGALGALGLILPGLSAGFSLMVAPLSLAGRGAFALGRYFWNAARGAVALQSALAGMSGMQFTGLARIAVGLRGMLVAIPGLSQLGGILAGLGSVLAGVTAPAWLLVAAIAAAGVAVYKYWEPISNFMAGFGSAVGRGIAEALSSFGQLSSALIEWQSQKIFDFAEWLGFDKASISALTASISAFFSELPGKVGGWISGIFTQVDYSDEAEASFRSAGERAGQAMVDGIKRMFTALIDWFRGLGKLIVDAVGKIDLTSLIDMPSLPSLPSWLGGSSGSAGTPLPANQNAALPAQASPSAPAGPQQLNVQTQATVKVEGPGKVVDQNTSVSSPSPSINTGRAVGRP